MAKEEKSSVDIWSESIKKKYGRSIITPASAVLERVPEVISVSPRLDVALNGGIPEGSRVLIAGEPGVGKTTLALQIAKNAQKVGRQVIFCAVEGRFRQQTATCVQGLNVEDMILIESTRDKILTSEDYLSIAVQALKNIPGCVLIIDSFSNLTPSSRVDEEVSGAVRPHNPKILSDFCDQVANIIPAMGSVLIGIAHVYRSQGMYATTVIKGGQAIKYQSDVTLRCKSETNWMDKDKFLGKILKWEIKKTAIGAPFNGVVESNIRFGYGIDEQREIFDLALQCGLIENSGAWYTLTFLDENNPPKYQGEEKTFNQITTEQFDILSKKLKAMMG